MLVLLSEVNIFQVKLHICTKRYSLFEKQEILIYKQSILQVLYKFYIQRSNTNETYTYIAP